MSAKTGQRTEKVLAAINRAAENFRRRIATSSLNTVVQDAIMMHPPPQVGNRAGKVYFCSNIGTAPPTILFHCNKASLFTGNYQRYLDRKLRESFEFNGTPIKMIWREKTLRQASRSWKHLSRNNQEE